MAACSQQIERDKYAADKVTACMLDAMRFGVK